MELSDLIERLNQHAEERKLLMAAERYLSERERRVETALECECYGDRRMADRIRRAALQRRGRITVPDAIVKRLCWPGGVYAPAMAELDDLPKAEKAVLDRFWADYKNGKA